MGCTLLSIPGKVLASVILRRIQEAVDDILRQHQAGFRRNRSCNDQIFTLRQIIEKCVAGNTNVLINFIDFQKAFDSIQRPTVWNILRQYGIPEKIIDIIKGKYKDSRCTVRVEGNLGNGCDGRTSRMHSVATVVPADDRLGDETRHERKKIGLGLERS